MSALTLCSYLLALAPMRAARAAEPEEPAKASSVVGESANVAHAAAVAAVPSGGHTELNAAIPNGTRAEPAAARGSSAPPSVAATQAAPPGVVTTQAAPPGASDSVAPSGGPSKIGAGGSAISLPSGSATIQGMGESFSAQLSTGIASLTVPLASIAGRGDTQASLALGYSSAGGHGVAGLGWSVGVPSIARQTDRTTPSYRDPAPGGPWNPAQDRFLWNAAEELVPICLVGNALACDGAPSETMPAWATGWQYFRARVESTFLRFFWSPNHRTWRIQDKTGIQFELGVPLDGSYYTGALEADPADPSKIFQWHVVRQYDAHVDDGNGQPLNVITYRYIGSGGLAYLSDVYAAPPRSGASTAPLGQYAHHVRLRYEARPDPITAFRRGWETRASLRLQGVDIASKTFAGGPSSARELSRRVHLTYDAKYHASELASIQVEGRCSFAIAEDAAEAI
ncbi:MAG TPA: SpvB/TcaC N-terminal domain-containing protein, partial [Polyangiaceae bacterium]|nr:SpvB/TcaC N-terminal domain-containing protein [Polyangiaceae bacterium]